MHKLHPRGCRSSWQWLQPLLLQTTHLYPSPCWPEDKGQVNPGAPASPLFSLTTREEETRGANSEFLPAGGWDNIFNSQTSHPGLWNLEAWLEHLFTGRVLFCCMTARACKDGKEGTNLNFSLHLDREKQELSKKFTLTPIIFISISVSASKFRVALSMCLKKLHVPRFPLSHMLFVFSKRLSTT